MQGGGWHAALLAAGVSNIDTYPVQLTDKKTGRVVDGYLAFNIIGVIAAADVTASRYASGPADCLMSADIGLLAVESEKVAEVKMFRLAESSSTILVSEEVKASFEAGGMSTVTFLPFEQ